MAKTSAIGKEIEILSHDIFDVIFALLILQGYKNLSLRRRYDEACVAVYKEVEKMCVRNNVSCGFYMVQHPIHGDSQGARDLLREWCANGRMYLHLPGDGTYHFTVSQHKANTILEHSIKFTGFGREDFEYLALTFLNIYES